jgi:3-hydroxybutyryl-CoA dehydratase
MSDAIGPAYFFEDLHVGMEASLVHTVAAQDVRDFARISGDVNPIHLDEAYAKQTQFRRTIAHGLLTASYISAVFGSKLPGPGCIYISQTLNFKAPIHAGDEVTATVRISSLIEHRKRAIFNCQCTVGEKTVLEGEAVLLVPSRAAK